METARITAPKPQWKPLKNSKLEANPKQCRCTKISVPSRMGRITKKCTKTKMKRIGQTDKKDTDTLRHLISSTRTTVKINGLSDKLTNTADRPPDRRFGQTMNFRFCLCHFYENSVFLCFWWYSTKSTVLKSQKPWHKEQEKKPASNDTCSWWWNATKSIYSS